MALHLHEGQMFRHHHDGVYLLTTGLDGILRLFPVVQPVSFPSVSFAVDVVAFADEVEAGIWVPFDSESTFAGLRPSTDREVVDTILLGIATDFGLQFGCYTEKEVLHA